jgi:CRISPR-associated protein Cmr5
MTGIRTHLVATAAYAVVVTRNAPDFKPCKKKYGALAHKLPGLILQNGLAQATGFLLAKGKEEHLALLSDLRQVLHATGTTAAGNGQDLHTQIIAADLGDTMRLTRHTLEVAGWIKRYVQGVLGVDATGDVVDETRDDSAEGA